jgi:hypothetical protein
MMNRRKQPPITEPTNSNDIDQLGGIASGFEISFKCVFHG